MASPRTDDRAVRLEQRLAVPVVLAALAAVPATFLTMAEGRAATAGHALHWLSLAVLTAESVVPLALSRDRRAWLRTHRVPVAVTVAAVPAVLLALGPVQILRLVRFVGALRILRVRRILRASRVLQRRLGDGHPLGKAGVAVGGAAAAAFTALVLADPSSRSRGALDAALARFGVWPAVLAGVVLGAATFVVARRRRVQREELQWD